MVMEKVLWSIQRSYQTIWSSPLPNTKWHSVIWPYTMETLNRSDFKQSRDLITKLDLLSNFRRFPKNIFDQFGMPTGDVYSSGHLVPSDLGLAYVLLVDTNPFPEIFPLFFRTMQFEHTSVLFRFRLPFPNVKYKRTDALSLWHKQ